ncbi:unnamed protein product, partial [marine sediment metagenome]
MAIARLTDPSKTGRHQNASLENLLNKLVPSLQSNLAHQWRSELKDLNAHCALIRKIRDRIIAHNDLGTALQYDPDPLPGISRAYIESVLEKIRKFIGDIEEHFRGIRTSHYHVFTCNDGESLIYALESAREYKKRTRNPPSNRYPAPKEGGTEGEVNNMWRKWFSKNFLTLILALATLTYAFLTFFIFREYKRQTDTAYEMALKNYHKAMIQNPNDFFSMERILWTYISTERFDEALNTANQMIDMRTDYYRGYSLKGTALYHLRKFDESLDNYRIALEYATRKGDTRAQSSILSNRANVHLMMENWEFAVS